MVEQALQKIGSDSRTLRLEGWMDLQEQCTVHHAHVTLERWQWLIQTLSEEEDDGVKEAGMVAMLAVNYACARVEKPAPMIENQAAPAAPGVHSLASWLWTPFHRSSAVFGVTATKYSRRDESALLQLGRRLSFAEFHNTDFPQINANSDRWSQLLQDRRYHAICLVGRPGLFGQLALDRLSSDEPRFGFDVHHRPDGLPAGQLDPQYHRIYEDANGKRKYYESADHDGHRVDYGLVQRYQVTLGGRRITVVVVAGASSLGTLAAAQWAARDLFRSTDSHDISPIETPPGIRSTSCVEALLYAKAPQTTSAWQPKQIDLQRLRVDNQEWLPEKRKWNQDAASEITLVRIEAKWSEILLDGTRARFRTNSHLFKLLAAMLEQANGKTDYIFDAQELANDERIWGKGNKQTVRYVRQQIASLKSRHLHGALNNKGHVQLHAKAKVIDRQS